MNLIEVHNRYTGDILSRDIFMLDVQGKFEGGYLARNVFVKVSCPQLQIDSHHELVSDYVKLQGDGAFETYVGVKSYRSHAKNIVYGTTEEFEIEADLVTADGRVLAETTFQLKMRMA